MKEVDNMNKEALLARSFNTYIEQTSYNCLAYAIGEYTWFTIDRYEGPIQYLEVLDPYSKYRNTLNEVLNTFLSDLRITGVRVLENSDEVLGDEYLVVFYYDTDLAEFHLCRQLDENTWAHKMGENNVELLEGTPYDDYFEGKLQSEDGEVVETYLAVKKNRKLKFNLFILTVPTYSYCKKEDYKKYLNGEMFYNLPVYITIDAMVKSLTEKEGLSESKARFYLQGDDCVIIKFPAYHFYVYTNKSTPTVIGPVVDYSNLEYKLGDNYKMIEVSVEEQNGFLLRKVDLFKEVEAF